MHKLTITREKVFLGGATWVYIFADGQFLDDHRIIKSVENGGRTVKEIKDDIVAIKCRIGPMRAIDSGVFDDIYVLDFNGHENINLFISIKEKPHLRFTDDNGNTIKCKTLLDYVHSCGLIHGNLSKKDKQVLYKSFVPCKNFAPTKDCEHCIAIDEGRKKWSFYLDGHTLHMDTYPPHRVYNYGDLESFELLEDGSSITKGGLGGALVGGLLFGGVGAVVGAATSSKTTRVMCEKMEIRIKVNNKKDPYITIPLLKEPVHKNSSKYNEAIKTAKNILTALNNIYEENIERKAAKEERRREFEAKDVNLNAAPKPVETIESKKEEKPTFGNISIADEIKKFKELLDIGAITQEEFNKVKKDLLNL